MRTKVRVPLIGKFRVTRGPNLVQASRDNLDTFAQEAIDGFLHDQEVLRFHRKTSCKYLVIEKPRGSALARPNFQSSGTGSRAQRCFYLPAEC